MAVFYLADILHVTMRPNNQFAAFHCLGGLLMQRSSIALLIVGCLAPLVAADNSPSNTLTESEKAAGWKLLFDGKTTSGWRNYQRPDIAAGWKVENGELVRGTEKAG